MHDQVTVYAAKCFWPGSTEREVEQATQRVVSESYLGSMFFPADELVLCLFAGASRTAVQRAVTRAGIPSDRIMQSVWMPRQQPSPSMTPPQENQR
jgi:hypothetical protein